MFKILKAQQEVQEFLKDSLFSFGYFTDLHLNPRDPHGKAGTDSVSPRFYEKIEILNNIFSFFNNFDLQFITNGGDTFHHPRIAERFKADYLNAIKQSAHPVITIIGNHDASSYDHVLSSIESWVQKGGLTLKEHAFVSEFSPIIFPVTKYSFYFIPYTLNMNKLKLPENKLNAPIIIAFMHNEIAGKSPEGYPLSTYSQIKAEDLSKDIYWIFGHYHTRTQYAKNVLFAGASARNTFADSWQPGCSIFKVTERGVESLFCPIEDRKYKKFSINVSDKKALKELPGLYTEEDIVHIVLTGKKDEVNTQYSILSTSLPTCFSLTITKEPNTVFDDIKRTTDIQGITQIMSETVKQNAINENFDPLMQIGNALIESNEHEEFMEKISNE